MEIITFEGICPLRFIKEGYWWSGLISMTILMKTRMDTSMKWRGNAGMLS